MSAGGELRRGDRALVLAARLGWGPAELSAFRELCARGLDWEGLLEDGLRFGMLPLLHVHLCRPELRDQVPARVLAHLESAYRTASIRSLRLFALLEDLEARMAARGIPVIRLKGALTGPWLYRDSALRPMNDLDILVRPRDRDAAWAILLEGGFHTYRDEVESQFNSSLDALIISKVSHLPALFLDRVCRLEVHLNVLSDGRGGVTTVMEDIWASPMEVQAGDARALGLPLEHLALHLAVHLDKHLRMDRSGPLYWFSDLHELVLREPGLRWDALARLANEQNAGAALGRVLATLSTFWGTPVPPEALGRKGYDMARILEEGRRMVGRPRERRENLWRRLSMVRHAPGLWGKVRFLGALLVPSRAKMRAFHNPRGPAGWVFWYLAHPWWKGYRVVRFLGTQVLRPRMSLLDAGGTGRRPERNGPGAKGPP